MKITNLGHASFLFQGNNISFVVDPYRKDSVPGLKFPKVSANYSFKSHDHYDHDAVDQVKLLLCEKELKYEVITVPHDHHGGMHRGLNKMHIFYIDGLKIIHTGDLGCIPSKEILDKMMCCDILLAPINGFYTISADELYQIYQIVKPKLLIPMHYYKAEDNSGYPDGGQIDKFKKLFSGYLEVKGYDVVIDPSLLRHHVLIFDRAFQGE